MQEHRRRKRSAKHVEKRGFRRWNRSGSRALPCQGRAGRHLRVMALKTQGLPICDLARITPGGVVSWSESGSGSGPLPWPWRHRIQGTIPRGLGAVYRDGGSIPVGAVSGPRTVQGNVGLPGGRFGFHVGPPNGLGDRSDRKPRNGPTDSTGGFDSENSDGGFDGVAIPGQHAAESGDFHQVVTSS